MVTNFIKSDLEFFEVLNCFPCLKNKLERLRINTTNLKEGETVYDFLQKQTNTEDEINLIITKLNEYIGHFLKTDNNKDKRELDILYI